MDILQKQLIPSSNVDFVSLQKHDYNSIHSWYSEQISRLFRKKYQLYPNEFNEELFNKLLSKLRFSSMIWYDQIRIGVVSSIIIEQHISHSIFIRPFYLSRISILSLLKIYHFKANDFFHTDFAFEKSYTNAVCHFQETKFNINKILDTKMNFNYVKSL